MFERLKALVGAKPLPKSQVERVPIMELKNRPFTLALVLRAAQETDESMRSLAEMVGTMSPIPEVPSLDGKISSAVSVVAHEIVHAAAKEAGCNDVYLPGTPLPKDAVIVMVFGFFVVMGMINPLASEGYKIEFPEACANLVATMLLMHTTEERIEAHKTAVAVFQKIARGAEHANVRGWIDNTTQLVMYYVEQFTSPVPANKETKYVPLFASQLKSLLKVQE